MKIKGKYNIPDKILMIICAVTTIILTALRFADVKLNIDPVTGFYNKSDLLGIISFVIILICVIFFIATSFVSKSANEFVCNKIKNKSAFWILLLAFAFFLDAVQTVLSRPVAFESKITSLGFILRIVLSVLSAVYFAILFTDERKGTDKVSNLKVLALAPVVYSAVRMIMCFVTKISFLRVSDLFLQIAGIGFLSLFFMAFAQAKSDVYSKGTSWKLFAYGYSAVIILFMSGMPKLVYSIADSSLINPDYPLQVVDLIASVFIFTYLSAKRNTVKDDKDTDTVKE